MPLACIGGMLFCSPINPSFAEDGKNLKVLEVSIEKEMRLKEIFEMQSHALKQEARNIRGQLIAAAKNTQKQEYLISSLEDKLIELRSDVTYRKHRLKERRGQLSGTLGALTKLSDESASAFFLFPGTPTQSVHSAMLLKSAVPALRDRATILKSELSDLARVKNDISLQLATLKEAGEQLSLEQENLNQLLRTKDILAKRTAASKKDAEKRLGKLVKEAKSLKDLLSKLNRIRPVAKPEEKPEQQNATNAFVPDPLMEKPSSLTSFPNKGAIPFPVSGRVVQRYGQDLGFGQSAKGIKIRTRPSAQLIASHDGQIAFAGPFRDHGLIIIIEHLGGYHTILSGLESANVITGQWVLSGEPIGVMSKTKKNGLELYVELRREGKPLNPLRWFKYG